MTFSPPGQPGNMDARRETALGLRGWCEFITTAPIPERQSAHGYAILAQKYLDATITPEELAELQLGHIRASESNEKGSVRVRGFGSYNR